METPHPSGERCTGASRSRPLDERACREGILRYRGAEGRAYEADGADRGESERTRVAERDRARSARRCRRGRGVALRRGIGTDVSQIRAVERLAHENA